MKKLDYSDRSRRFCGAGEHEIRDAAGEEIPAAIYVRPDTGSRRCRECLLRKNRERRRRYEAARAAGG